MQNAKCKMQSSGSALFCILHSAFCIRRGAATMIAIDIVAERRNQSPIIVVSALAGITNELVAASEAARDQKPDEVKRIMDRIRQRHEDVAMQLVQQKFDFFDAFLKQLNRQIEQIQTILSGISLLGEI